jgi:ribosomal protein S16
MSLKKTLPSEDISLNEVQKIIASGAEFSCTVIELSEKKKTGGDIKTYIAAKLLTEALYMKILTGRPMTANEKAEKGLGEFDPTENANAENPKWTYGLRYIATGANFTDIRRIRPLLITIFNNKKVIA